MGSRPGEGPRPEDFGRCAESVHPCDLRLLRSLGPETVMKMSRADGSYERQMFYAKTDHKGVC